MPKDKTTNTQNKETLEQKLWKAADKLRKNIDAAEYKHIVLGLVFLKYISDSFEQLHEKLSLECVQNSKALSEFDLAVCSRQVESQLSRYIPSSVKLMTFSIPVNLLVLQARLAAVEMKKLI